MNHNTDKFNQLFNYVSIKMSPKQEKSLLKNFKIVLLIITLLLIVFGAILLVNGQNLVSEGEIKIEHAIAAEMGEIIPFTIDTSKNIEVFLGNVIISVPYSYLANFGINIADFVDFHIEYPIRVKFIDNKISIDATIKNANGQIIAKIVNNNWTISHDPLLARDRNYNAYAFEVIDSDLVPVLQIILVSPNRIDIRCCSYTSSGIRVLIDQKGIMINPTQKEIEKTIGQTIFHYPSATHLGKMVTPFFPSESPISEASQRIEEGKNFQILGIILSSGAIVTGVADILKLISEKEKSKTEILTEENNQTNDQHKKKVMKRKQKIRRRKRKKQIEKGQPKTKKPRTSSKKRKKENEQK